MGKILKCFSLHRCASTFRWHFYQFRQLLKFDCIIQFVFHLMGVFSHRKSSYNILSVFPYSVRWQMTCHWWVLVWTHCARRRQSNLQRIRCLLEPVTSWFWEGWASINVYCTWVFLIQKSSQNSFRTLSLLGNQRFHQSIKQIWPPSYTLPAIGRNEYHRFIISSIKQ